MRRLRSVVASTVLTVAAFSLVPPPVNAACQKCKYIWFVGMRCSSVSPGENGKTGCNDNQTCGLYGSPCTGAPPCEDDGSCPPDEEGLLGVPVETCAVPGLYANGEG